METGLLKFSNIFVPGLISTKWISRVLINRATTCLADVCNQFWIPSAVCMKMRVWVEIVTLVIPSFNDSDDELARITEFLVSVSPDIPWHVTALHKDYKISDAEDAPPESLFRAAEIGKKAGLHYISAGNLPGEVGDRENTRCHECKELVVGRFGYRIINYPRGIDLKLAIALYKPQSLETLHKQIHPRAGCADHRCHCLLAYLVNQLRPEPLLISLHQ